MAAAPPADWEPLIRRSPAAGGVRRRWRWQQLLPTWLSGLALLSFVATTVVAAVQDRREPWKVAFAVGVLVNVVSLFGTLAAYDGAPPPEGAGRTRRLLKVAVWALATSLDLAFSLRAAAAAAASAAVCFSVGSMATFVAFAGALVLVVEGGDGPDAGRVEPPNEYAGGERRQREPPPKWLLWLALLFFLANAAVATVGQPRRVHAVVGVSLSVLWLLCTLGTYDRAPPENVGRARRWLWAATSALASLLNLEFYFRAMAAPAAVSTALGCMATATEFVFPLLMLVDLGGECKAGDEERGEGSQSQS